MAIILTSEQLAEIMIDHKYPVAEVNTLQSRCFDNVESGGLPLSLPGGDMGEIALLAATGNEYGFDVHIENAAEILADLTKINPLQTHTGCNHIANVLAQPDRYHIVEDQAVFMKKYVKGKNKSAVERGALLIINGPYTLSHSCSVTVEGYGSEVYPLLFHKTFVDIRHRALAQKLVESGVVTLFDGCDTEYLYEALCDVTQTHLFETVKQWRGLPIYEIHFKESGEFKVTEIGTI